MFNTKIWKKHLTRLRTAYAPHHNAWIVTAAGYKMLFILTFNIGVDQLTNLKCLLIAVNYILIMFQLTIYRI